MSRTIMRGLSEAKLSWNTICTCRRYSLGESCSPIACPLKRMAPSSRAIRSMMSRAVVDLPQPDSPTMPSVSPGITSNEMPSTARTTCFSREISPLPGSLKCLRRP